MSTISEINPNLEKVTSRLVSRLGIKEEQYKPVLLAAFNSIATIEDSDYPLSNASRSRFEASKLIGESYEDLITRIAQLCVEEPDIIQMLNDYIKEPKIKLAVIEAISDLEVPNISTIPEMLLFTEKDPNLKLQIVSTLEPNESFFSFFSSRLFDNEPSICREALKKLNAYDLEKINSSYTPYLGKVHSMTPLANGLIKILEGNPPEDIKNEAIKLLKKVVRIRIR